MGRPAVELAGWCGSTGRTRRSGVAGSGCSRAEVVVSGAGAAGPAPGRSPADGVRTGTGGCGWSSVQPEGKPVRWPPADWLRRGPPRRGGAAQVTPCRRLGPRAVPSASTAERRQPFDDLVALCSPWSRWAVVDLGCGTGELTAELHRGARAPTRSGSTVSESMLAARRGPRTSRACASSGRPRRLDGHRRSTSSSPTPRCTGSPTTSVLLARLRIALAPGGQLAFQVPAELRPSVARAGPGGGARSRRSRPARRRACAGPGDAVLSPATYAELLHALGATCSSRALQVYGHVLDATASGGRVGAGHAADRVPRAARRGDLRRVRRALPRASAWPSSATSGRTSTRSAASCAGPGSLPGPVRPPVGSGPWPRPRRRRAT